MEQKPSAPSQAGFETTPLSGLDKFRRNGCFNFEISDIKTYASATEEEKELLRDSTEFQPSLQKGMESLLVNRYIDDFKKLIALNLHTPETLQWALQKGMEGLLVNRYIDDFKELLALNLHTPETLQLALQKGMESFLANGYIDHFKKLIALNLHTLETVAAIQPALQKGMESFLANGYIDHFKKLIALNLHTPETLMNVYDVLLADAKYLEITTLVTYDAAVKEKWNVFVSGAQQKAYDNSISSDERRGAQDFLVFLLEQGDKSIFEQTENSLKDCLQTTRETPLTPQQETAIYIFEKLNTQKTNTLLFDLLVAECLPQGYLDTIAHHLVKGETQFATSEIRKAMRKYMYQNHIEGNGFEHVSWKRGGEYLQTLYGIRSTVLRQEVINSVGSMVFKIDDLENIHSQYPHIPQTALLQCISINKSNPGFLEYMHTAYVPIRNSQSNQEKMLFNVTKLVWMEHRTRDVFFDTLQRMPCKTEEDVTRLDNSIRTFLFAIRIPELLQEKGGYYDEGGDWIEDYNEENTISNEPLDFSEIFAQVNSFEELQRVLHDFITSQIQSILPHEKITAEQFGRLYASWEDIEPILTYLNRYKNNKQYIAEIVAHADTESNWQKWRYDLKRKTVKEQIGFLNDEERVLWQRTSVQKIEAMIQESDLSKPQQIQSHIIEAILRDKHLVEGEKKYEWSQEYLESVLRKYEQVDQNKEAVLREAIQNIQSYVDGIGEYALSFDSAKIENILKGTFARGNIVPISAKIEGALDNLRSYLDSEVFKTCIERYKEYKKAGVEQTKAEDIISPEVYRIIEEKLISLQSVAQKLKENDVWQKVRMEEKDVANRGAVYQKIRELAGVANILRLVNMQMSHLMTNILVEGKVKKEGLTVSGVVTELQKTFQGSSFVGNIKNIEAMIATTLEVKRDRSLAIIISDNPSLLWQAGKYPLGNGSCQEYAAGSMAQSLMGYVGDAHTKVLYMFDVNMLPQEAKDRIAQGESLEDVTSSLTPSDLLQSVVARSVIKLTESGKGIPTLFIEPIYTTLNKQDHEMDRTVIEFLSEYVAKPMHGRIAKGTGSSLSVHFPASANPFGQYEDGAYGNAAHAGQGIKLGSYSLKTSLKVDFSVDKK